tara:strand:- start:256 stop:435 length:180 start_codon:yes stop_codon:yes gene_type:complete
MTYDSFPKKKSLFDEVRTIFLFLMVGGLFFWVCSSSLDKMTRIDCEVHNITAACESLKK